MTLRRAVFITGIVVLCVWTLLPIYLIALGAVGGRTVVNSWPKPFLPPADLSFATMREFLDIAGVWTSALYSVEAAVQCMAFSILLGVPAGYALARFVFAGATAYRLVVLLTRAFPVAILALPLTVGFIRLGLYDTPLGVSLMHTALALPFAVLVSASLFQAIPKELEEAAWVFGCSPVRAFLRVVLPLERGIRRLRADGTAQDAYRLPALGSVREPAACAVRRWLRADHPLGAVHLSRSQAPLFDVGHRQPMSAG
jgi:multiple sugar transport system permease protein